MPRLLSEIVNGLIGCLDIGLVIRKRLNSNRVVQMGEGKVFPVEVVQVMQQAIIPVVLVRFTAR